MLLSITAAEGTDKAAPFPLQNGTFEAHIAHAAAAGFAGLELQLRDPAALGEARLRRYLERHNMRVTSLATGLACREGLSLSSLDEKLRAGAVSRVCAHIDLAKRLDAKPAVLIGLLIGKLADAKNANAYFSALGDSLRRVTEHAVRAGIDVCIEPVNHRDSDALNTWEEMTDFLDRADCGEIRLALDLYHMRMEETDLVQTIGRFSKRIGLVQMMDDNRLAPGLGCFRFAPIAQAVLDAGYDGPITMEFLPLPDADTAMRLAVEFYHTYFAQSIATGGKTL